MKGIEVNESSLGLLESPVIAKKDWVWKYAARENNANKKAPQDKKCDSISWRWIFAYNLSDLFLVSSAIFFEQIICISLSRGLRIGVVEQILYTDEDLFDSDRRPPSFFFVENRKANRSGRIDIGME